MHSARCMRQSVFIVSFGALAIESTSSLGLNSWLIIRYVLNTFVSQTHLSFV